MNLPRLWCAGKLGNCPPLRRFHFTCLYCRSRRRFYGKFTEPPYWIQYTFPWAFTAYVFLNPHGRVLAKKTHWKSIEIDPRGHFTSLRCAIIVTLDKIMRRFPKTKKPLMEFCEFFANYPVW